jgi:UDP-3-O-[3-hydroxymyristoyl] glucosamine N-acyltransferase
MRVRELAERLGLSWEGDGERELTGVAPLETAGAGDLSFAVGKSQRRAAASAAGCLIVPEDQQGVESRTLIRSRDPRASMAQAIPLLRPVKLPAPGIHPTAVIGNGCGIAEDASIGAFCAIGDGVTIGPGSVLMPRVTVYSGTTIGARALIHSGVVLGADGFGFIRTPAGYEKFPQVGSVVIGDDVEIGANSTVDRAALGHTVVGDGSKLDNMVHIGHNCTIGKRVVIAAQTGLAGGTVVEDDCVIGGQVGIGDNVTIRRGAILGSGCGVLTGKIVPGGGIVYWGTPARPLKEYLENLASLSRLGRRSRKSE